MIYSLRGRRARLLAASAGALLLLLTASCGGDDSDDESGASPSPITAAAAETVQPSEPSPTTTAVDDSGMDDSEDMPGDGMDGSQSASSTETDESDDMDESGDMADEGSDGDDMAGMLDPIGALAEVRTLDDGSLQVYSEIVIAATPEQVWAVLTDFETMPEWSDTFQGLAGDLSDGGEAVATFLVEGQAFPFPHVLSWEEGRSFGWSDPLIFAPGIVDDHRYIVDRTDGVNTLFVQYDTLTGDDPDVPAVVLADQLVQAYAWFNQQLKAEVERRVVGGGDMVETLDPQRSTAEVRTLDDGSLLAYTEVVIEATPEQVWAVLTDFETMPDWSFTFQGLTGDLSDGGEAVATYIVEGAPLEFPHVIDWEEGRSFGWSDPILFAPGIVDDHRFVIDRTDGERTLFIQTDTLTGDDPNFPAAILAEQLVTSYEFFNQQLKTEVERRSP